MTKPHLPCEAAIVLGLTVACFVCIHLSSAGKSKSVADSATELRKAKELREQILAEIQELGEHEWAGDYYAGDGLGFNRSLILAPRSGYAFTSHGCLGVYDRNHGAVASTDGRLQLSFTFVNQRTGFEGIAPEFFAVSWGSRRYLIPSDGLVEFCNTINLGREPRASRRGVHLLRVGDESKPVTGLPVLPAEFRDYLLPAPVTATITEIGDVTLRRGKGELRFREIAMTLDAGQKDGLRTGMELVVTIPRESFGSVQITRVDESHSQAVMTQVFDGDRTPQVGWRVSTRSPLYDRDPE